MLTGSYGNNFGEKFEPKGEMMKPGSLFVLQPWPVSECRRSSDFSQVATIPVRALFHGIWPFWRRQPLGEGLRRLADGDRRDHLVGKRIVCAMRCRQVPEGKTYTLRRYASVLLAALDDEDGFIINAVLLTPLAQLVIPP